MYEQGNKRFGNERLKRFGHLFKVKAKLQGIFLAQDPTQVSALQADYWPSEPPGKPIQGQMVNKCKAKSLSLVFIRPKPGLLIHMLSDFFCILVMDV